MVDLVHGKTAWSTSHDGSDVATSAKMREAGLKPCATEITARLTAFAKATVVKKPDTTY